VNKSDLVNSIAAAAGIKKTEADKALDAVFDSITEALVKGDEVRLIGFGTFAVSHRPASEGRNPRTGDKLKIPAKKLPKFRPGKGLKEAVAK
jgi:DNA-binding protein HU-beta